MNPIFILVGPSGVGKSTVQDKLLADPVLHLVRAITTTTRVARPTETEGMDFFFLSPEDFQKKVNDDGFVEWVETFGRSYGTSRDELNTKLAQGPVLMITDMRGAHSIKKVFADTHIIFLDAPREDLERRIRERPGTTAEDLERRLKRMDEEKSSAKEADVVIENPDGSLEMTVRKVRDLISASLARRVH
jgi:guanylate kinase